MERKSIMDISINGRTIFTKKEIIKKKGCVTNSKNSNKPVVYPELLDCLKLRRQKPGINSISMRLAMDQLNL